MRQAEWHAKFARQGDNLRLAEADERRVNGQRVRPSTPARVARLAIRLYASIYSGRQSG